MQRGCDLSRTKAFPSRKKMMEHCDRETETRNASLAVFVRERSQRRGVESTYILLRREWPRETWPLPKNVGEEVDRGFMSAQNTIDELVRMMRARASRYKILAEGLYDQRTAAEVSAYADELEAEAKRLADSRPPLVASGLGAFCH